MGGPPQVRDSDDRRGVLRHQIVRTCVIYVYVYMCVRVLIWDYYVCAYMCVHVCVFSSEMSIFVLARVCCFVLSTFVCACHRHHNPRDVEHDTNRYHNHVSPV